MNNIKDKKVVLAYSGGLDTSAIIPWIKERYGLKVIAFIADIGQSKYDLSGIKEKALSSGADDVYLVDLKEEFVASYVYPILQTGALYEGNYLLGTAMARPIIAKKQVELALNLNAVALCHGATGKGNDQVRFESVYTALAPHLNVLAPWRLWNFRSREDLIGYLKNKNIATNATLEKIYSRDENAWHVSTEGGCLENPWNRAKNDIWTWTVDPEQAPDQSENVSIIVNKGLVVSVNNVNMTPFKCLKVLNRIGCKHGIGRIDIVENRLVGIKSRGCYETPGGTIIVRALREIEQLVLDRESFKWREQLGLEMSSIVYDGKWFTPIRKSIQASATSLSNEVSGEVVLKLYKGNVIIVKKRSKNTLYSKEFATFSNDEVYDHTDAGGFIKIFSLSSKIRAMRQHEK